jgi:hypothetical protein
MEIKVTTHKTEIVQVSERDIFKAMIECLEKRHRFLERDYIDDDMYFELDYIHPHNRDEVYKDPRPATQAEKLIYNTYHHVLEMYKGL